MYKTPQINAAAAEYRGKSEGAMARATHWLKQASRLTAQVSLHPSQAKATRVLFRTRIYAAPCFLRVSRNRKCNAKKQTQNTATLRKLPQ